MKFPYGLSDFNKIIRENYFYCDRTDRIRTLESAGNSLLFLRPRRFGKSLLLSMLANYYDVAKAESFDKIFGSLLIGQNPTKLHNKYFILKFDFSCVESVGDSDDIKRALYDHINDSIIDFTVYYEDYLKREVQINSDNALSSIKSLITSIRKSNYPIYLLIDEYDNFANEVMMSDKRGKDRYEAIVHGDGILKTLFKQIKSSTGESLFERTFITGVSPVVMSDITSGYNIAKNIYLKPQFNDLCGFTEKEITDTLEKIEKKCSFKKGEASAALDIMREYYNGYSFDYESPNNIYNSTLALYFFDNFYEYCRYPNKMLDGNLAVDEAKLKYIAGIPGGQELLLSLPENDNHIAINELEERFGIQTMIENTDKDFTFMASFLYFFGVLTMAGRSTTGKRRLRVPNMVTQGLYVERIRKMLLPEPMERQQGVFAAEKLFEQGNIKPLCEFIEQNYFKIFSNRDYLSANELTIKTIFLTLLYNNLLYIMDSEPETDRGYADLTMIIRPDMRQFDILDILLEFKFVSLKEAGITGEQAKNLNRKELEAISEMQTKMTAAKEQLRKYGATLENKYKNLHLKKFAVVALGFERLWAEEV
jgi:hypothetical protein